MRGCLKLELVEKNEKRKPTALSGEPLRNLGVAKDVALRLAKRDGKEVRSTSRASDPRLLGHADPRNGDWTHSTSLMAKRNVTVKEKDCRLQR